jgi:hypothetical protein
MYIINKYFHLTPLIQREPNIAESKRSRRLTYFGVVFFMKSRLYSCIYSIYSPSIKVGLYNFPIW